MSQLLGKSIKGPPHVPTRRNFLLEITLVEKLYVVGKNKEKLKKRPGTHTLHYGHEYDFYRYASVQIIADKKKFSELSSVNRVLP